MNLTDNVSTHLFKNADKIFRDGTTLEDVRGVLSGLDSALEGQLTKIVEDTTILKSYVDKQRASAIQTREDKLNTDFSAQRSLLEKELEQVKSSNTTLKANMPISADPAELRKQALDETDPVQRRMLILEAANIEMSNKDAERTAREEKQLAELSREKLVNVARNRFGDRKLPSFVLDNLGAFIGSDEETTNGKIDAINVQWDDISKDMLTAGLNPSTPSGIGEQELDPEAEMNRKMNDIDF